MSVAFDSEGTPSGLDEAAYSTRADAVLTIARLAAVDPIEYDRRRKLEAEVLGVRVDTLDSQVQKARQAGGSGGEARPPEFSDETLALRFTARHHKELRYVAAWSQWLIADGVCWRADKTMKAFDLARAICREASSECPDDRLAPALASAKTVAAVERLAKADRQHAATADQWDLDPWALNTPGGIVDLRTGLMRDAHPDDYVTRMTAIAPGDDGCPLWRDFLNTVTKGDKEMQLFLQRMAGYCLTGITKEHALFFAYGTGRNGKGTFINTLTAILANYAVTASMETFTSSPGERHPTDLAMLRGARLVTAQETEEGRRWAEGRIKALTGGDPITARFMRADFFTYLPQFKLLAAGNHRPGLRHVDEAIRRRFHLLPFDLKLSAEEQDADLPDKLRAEWPCILQWAIDGCLLWQEHSLAAPDIIRRATDDYLAAEDAMALWLAERCKRIGYGKTEASSLFASWRHWAAGAGEEPGPQKAFSQALEARGYQKTRTTSGRMAFEGVALNDIQPPRTEPSHERD
jgi:putative DNA primase/helicase